jgi:hypothetical protein
MARTEDEVSHGYIKASHKENLQHTALISSPNCQALSPQQSKLPYFSSETTWNIVCGGLWRKAKMPRRRSTS